jgi:hypothetical protein
VPTRLQLEQEPWWGAEREAPAHAAFNARLREHYGHTRAETGSKGDQNHLRGRHRSRAWVANSAYCTDRTYGNRDARDKAGDANWLRATDVGISGAELRAASAQLDAAVKAGRLPSVAEWFGTKDGTHVTGWFDGHVSSSDSSHLYHLHVGVWTAFCDDAGQMDLLGDIITGEDDDMTPRQEYVLHVINYRLEGVLSGKASVTVPAFTASNGDKFPALTTANGTVAAVKALSVVVEQLAAAITAGGGTVDTAAILAGVDNRLASLRAATETDTRDAVADALEGGAPAVRADAP